MVRGDPVRAITEESDPSKGIDLRIHLEPNYLSTNEVEGKRKLIRKRVAKALQSPNRDQLRIFEQSEGNT